MTVAYTDRDPRPAGRLSQPAARLYAALDNDDRVAVIDTAPDRIVDHFHAASAAGNAPGAARLGGAGTNALAVTGDGARSTSPTAAPTTCR